LIKLIGNGADGGGERGVVSKVPGRGPNRQAAEETDKKCHKPGTAAPVVLAHLSQKQVRIDFQNARHLLPVDSRHSIRRNDANFELPRELPSRQLTTENRFTSLAPQPSQIPASALPHHANATRTC